MKRNIERNEMKLFINQGMNVSATGLIMNTT